MSLHLNSITSNKVIGMGMQMKYVLISSELHQPKNFQYINNPLIVKTVSQKHLGLNLYARLTFNDRKNDKTDKAMSTVGFPRKSHF